MSFSISQFISPFRISNGHYDRIAMAAAVMELKPHRRHSMIQRLILRGNNERDRADRLQEQLEAEYTKRRRAERELTSYKLEADGRADAMSGASAVLDGAISTIRDAQVALEG